MTLHLQFVPEDLLGIKVILMQIMILLKVSPIFFKMKTLKMHLYNKFHSPPLCGDTKVFRGRSDQFNNQKLNIILQVDNIRIISTQSSLNSTNSLNICNFISLIKSPRISNSPQILP